MAYDYDLILKGGEVVDPAQDLRGTRDVAFKDGKVAAIAPDIPREEGSQVFDVGGKIVVPGLIDLHGHFAYGFGPLPVDADVECMPRGVTTAVDGGSTGWVNFPAFRDYVIRRADTRLYAFIHLSALGQGLLAVQVPDLGDFRHAVAERAAQCIEQNSDLILGLKVRLGPTGTTDENAVPALRMAREVADRTGTHVMVHVMESSIPLAKVIEHLRAGDIITHCFHEDVHNMLDSEDRVRPEVREAVDQGILLDTGNAQRHFSIRLCRAVFEQGIYPHTISTDRVVPQRPGITNYNMLEDMTIYLEMGMPLEEVIRSVTSNGASAIGHPDLGSLSVGNVGDAAVLEMEEGEFAYEDLLGEELRAPRRFANVMTIKDGRRWLPR